MLGHRRPEPQAEDRRLDHTSTEVTGGIERHVGDPSGIPNRPTTGAVRVWAMVSSSSNPQPRPRRAFAGNFGAAAARERRNVNSCARRPKVSNAAGHNVRAST